MKKTYILIFLISIVLLVSFLGALNQNQIDSNGKVKLVIFAPGINEEYELAITGSSLDILKEVADVEVKNTLYSTAIQCVNGVCKDKRLGWYIYINGKNPAFGPHAYIPKDGDTIEFRFSYR